MTRHQVLSWAVAGWLPVGPLGTESRATSASFSVGLELHRYNKVDLTAEI